MLFSYQLLALPCYGASLPAIHRHHQYEYAHLFADNGDFILLLDRQHYLRFALERAGACLLIFKGEQSHFNAYLSVACYLLAIN